MIFTILFASISIAASDPVYVDVNPQVYSPKDFQTKKEGVVVREMKAKKPSKIPKKSARDALFKKVRGLDKYLESMDQFEKDSLYIRAQTSTDLELQKFYPQIPANILRVLKKQTRK